MKMKRQPIVVVLGHVDHGKTTLLDVIRNSRQAEREAGGITQSVGASEVMTSAGKITFIDTPGHKAFSSMRARGAKIADIAILVVAASEGPMPQTVEALAYIQEHKMPFVVAFTKADLPSANIESALSKMEKVGVLFEKRGGDVPYLSLSAKEEKGISELIDMIILLSEISELKGDPAGELDGIVIETGMDRGGARAFVIVKNGSVVKGEKIYADLVEGRARGIFDSKGMQVDRIGPGQAGAILGFSELPETGAVLSSTRSMSDKKSSKASMVDIGEGEIGVILRAATAGGLEAVEKSLPQGVKVLRRGVGEVNAQDVFFAKSVGGNIYAFEARVPQVVAKLAETESVEIARFEIIYELIEKLNEIIESEKKKVVARAVILASFPFEEERVAGGKVAIGQIKVGDKLTVMRGERVLGEVVVRNLRKQKEEVKSVSQGEEFGVLFRPQLDFANGDVIISYSR